MNPEETSSADYIEGAQFRFWAEAPGGSRYRVEGGLPKPIDGPEFSAGDGDGPVARLFVWRANRLIQRVSKGRKPAQCYVAVWGVPPEGDEVLVLEEITAGLEDGRRRGQELVVQIKAGQSPH